ncbi:MAG TPA: hypothetical protein VEB20_17310 [Azospirillaceae bacterium]|nr:hypothetical protein [Azospirillaceae bacterium]
MTGRSAGSGVSVRTVTSPAAVRMVAAPSRWATTWPPRVSARVRPARRSGSRSTSTSPSGTGAG